MMVEMVVKKLNVITCNLIFRQSIVRLGSKNFTNIIQNIADKHNDKNSETYTNVLESFN